MTSQGTNSPFLLNGESASNSINRMICSPHSRTDTQDALLDGPDGVSRFVELGPSRVLANLAHKTLQRKLAGGERPADATVKILASTIDTKALCYEYDPPDSVEETPAATPSSAAKQLVTESVPSIKLVPRSSNASTRPPSIEDSPVSGTDVVQILVARKLKKSISEVPTSKSIKDLCGGTSPFHLHNTGPCSD